MSTTQQQLSRYRQFRAVQMRLNHTLVRLLPTDAMRSCGVRLGILKNDTLVFQSESEVSVLADYCVYDYRWDGSNVIEKYLAANSFKAGSDERILLEAMRLARYSVFTIEEVDKGLGVSTQDILRGDRGFIVDVGLSETAVRGAALACRILTPGDGGFSMSTGAALPASRPILKKIAQHIPAAFGKTQDEIARLSAERAADLSASIIRIFLGEDAASYITYGDPIGRKRENTAPNVGRNEPCPCGSGKKFKKCCGR